MYTFGSFSIHHFYYYVRTTLGAVLTTYTVRIYPYNTNTTEVFYFAQRKCSHHSKFPSTIKARSCQVNTHGQEVVPAGEAFTLTCTFNLEPEICTWHHDNPVDSGLPLDEEDATPTNNFDVLCSQVREKGETLCKGHRRISFDASGDGQKGRKSTTMTKVGRYLSKRTKKASKKKKKHRSHLKKLKSVRKSCTLRVSATTAEDAGEWRLEAMAMVDKHKMVKGDGFNNECLRDFERESVTLHMLPLFFSVPSGSRLQGEDG